MKGYSMHEKHRANPKRERERRQKREPSNILIKPKILFLKLFFFFNSLYLRVQVRSGEGFIAAMKR